MLEPDSPVTGSGDDTTLSFNDGVAAIESLLDEVPETDSPEADKSQQEQEQPDEGEDVLELGDEEGEQDEASQTEYSGGKFASDDAKVTLPDGSVVSVADLKTGHMFQRKFTEKTTELSREKEAFYQQQAQFAEYAQQLAKQREVIETLAAEFLPPEPSRQMLETDPIGYMQAKAEYDERIGKIQTLMQSRQYEQQHMTAAQQQAHQQMLQAEQQALMAAMPQLADKGKFEQFRNEALSIGSEAYGLRPEEIASVVDHRFVRVLADAIAYRKAIAKRDAGKQPSAQPSKQPPRVQQKQRMAPQSETSQRIKQAEAVFAKSRSIDAAAKLFENFV